MELKYKKLYERVLQEYQDLSTCDRLHVAAILVKDGRILSVGYNGVPRGQCHCNALFKHDLRHYYIKQDLLPGVNPEDVEWTEVSEETYSTEHHKFAEANEIHAEMNCIAFALKNGIDVNDCEMILSVAPCQNCAKLIASAGIKKITYCNKYDRSMLGEKFLKALNIDIQRAEQ